jgi:hypothetical protein
LGDSWQVSAKPTYRQLTIRAVCQGYAGLGSPPTKVGCPGKQLRDNADGMLEILRAYERDGLYYGVVRVGTPQETAALEFGVSHEGYLALRKILQTRPFGSMPGVPHSFYFAGDYGRDEIGVRIEEGSNGRKLRFPCPTPLISNLLWFYRMRDLSEAAALNRVEI